jgi:glutamate racemase
MKNAYGTKSKETVERYAVEDAKFLMKHKVKLIVAACNTVSAYALPALEKRLKVPVVGVIEPGARMAVGTTKLKRVGVIGTEGTIRSGAYFDAIKSLNSRVVISIKSCPLFVPLAEEGWTKNETARVAAKNYLDDMRKERIDTLVLGCTHYPLLKDTISMVMGSKVRLIDSGFAAAFEVQKVLQDNSLLKEDSGGTAKRSFFVTDSPERFNEVGKRFYEDGPIDSELVRL